MMLVGCRADLTTPTGLAIDQDTLELTWEEVDGANYYALSINGREEKSTKTSYKLERLDPGDYTIKVKAVGDGRSESEWSSAIPFTRETEIGMLYKLINSGTEYEVINVGTAGGDIVVPDTYRGRPVTSIGKKAFAKKNNVLSVQLGNNITNIGEQAFSQCEGLTSINIPVSVQTIGKKAFQSCSTLTSDLVVPESVTVIEEGTFGYCKAVKNITIGSNVEKIGESAFTDCDSLEKIVIPDSVVEIGDYAFSSCISAVEATIGKEVVTVGKEAFQGCLKLATLTLGESVLSLGDSCFESCVELTTVKIPEPTVVLGGDVFKGCTKLATVEMNDAIEVIGANAFLNTKIWTDADAIVYVGKWVVDCKDKTLPVYNVEEGTVGIATYAFASCSAVPTMILPNSVKLINDMAFCYMTNLANVVIGEGVEKIGVQSFSMCSKLTNVILGGYDFDNQKMTSSSLKEIGKYAFYQSELLSSIEIPETVEFIGAWAFRKTAMYTNATTGVVYAGDWLVDWNQDWIIFSGGNIQVKEGTRGIAEYALFQCKFVSELTLPDSVKYINRAAFYQMVFALKVQLPSELERIEEYAFYQCQQLMDINLPETLEYIGRSAFYQCSMLGCTVDETGTLVVDRDYTLVIPDSVKTIEKYAFYGCGMEIVDFETGIKSLYGVDKIVLGDGLETIGANAFTNFVTVKSVEFGDGMTTISDKAFYKCTNLEEIIFSSKVVTIGNRAFYGCTNLQSVILPDSVKEIADYAFYKCENLQTLQLNKGLVSIGNYAFSNCRSVESLYIPDSVESIGKQAFRNMKFLQSVTMSDSVVAIKNHAFYGCTLATFYVESDTKPEGWETRWNSSYRPVVWGVEISEEGYVVSFTKTAQSFTNINEKATLSAPARDGYDFLGWSTSANATTAEIQANGIKDVADGTTLYAVWQVKTP